MFTPTPPVNPFAPSGRVVPPMTVPTMPLPTADAAFDSLKAQKDAIDADERTRAEHDAALIESQKQQLAALEQMLAASKRTAEPAQAAVEMPATSGAPGFYVKLKDCAEMFVAATEAGDRMDAIEVYKGRCGILSTIHPFEVKAGFAPAE